MRQKIYLFLTVGLLLTFLTPLFGSNVAFAATKSSGTVKTSNLNITCDVGFNPLTWLLCPAVNGMEAIVNELENAMQQELAVGAPGNSTDPNQIFCDSSSSKSSFSTCSSYEQAWGTVRYIALGVLLLIGLVIIVAQALNLEVLDAYTIKRAMPRLVVAVILITLSWPLMQFFVTLTNALGYGIQYIMEAPFANLSDHLNLNGGGAAALSLFGAGGAIGALGIFGLLSFAVTAALSVAVAFLVMIIRQLLIVLLVILAPIAIVFMILPNTQKIFRMWLKEFNIALMMFPIITAVIAAGRIFSAISLQNGVNSSALDQFIGFAAYFAPYFMLPFTFKLAGGTLSSISGSLQNATRGINKGLSNYRKQRMAHNWSNLQAGKRWQGNPVANRVSKGLMNASLIGAAGVNPKNMKGKYHAARSQRLSALMAESEKSDAVKMVSGNDDLLTASLSGNMNEGSTREYLKSKGQSGALLAQNVAAVERARRDMGPEAWADFAAVANAGTKTGYGKGPGEMLEMINKVAGNDRARAGRLMNAARGQAERAGRIDLYGSSFGDSQSAMEDMYYNRINSDTANQRVTDSVLKSRRAGEIASASKGGLEIMSPAIKRRAENAQVELNKSSLALQTAQATGTGIEAAQDRFNKAQSAHKQVMAHTAAFIDVAGSVSPDNANIIADIIGSRAEPENKTYGQYIEDYRSDDEFQRYRREYGSATNAANAQAGQQAAEQQQAQQNQQNQQGQQ